jgi:SAM-dependent methyltransferase
MAAARPRTTVRTALVWDVLRTALEQLGDDGRPLHVVDAGGGTGGFAVPLAELGPEVTVVDPSPDSLAALDRRVAEAGTVTKVRALQGDAAGLGDLLAPESADLVLCHSVLEFVDEPTAALGAVAQVLRPGGLASILAANRVAAVVARVAAGRIGEASRLLLDADGSAGDSDPLQRRFAVEELHELCAAAGLQPRHTIGVRVFSDVVPPALVDGDPDAAAQLLALEHAAAERPEFLAVATQLHVLAERRR